MAMKLHTVDHVSLGAAVASTFLLLLPIYSPTLFSPLTGAYPSLLSEWNAPKPMHSNLLEQALDTNTENMWHLAKLQEKKIWDPLPYQGWTPCFGAAEIDKDAHPPRNEHRYIQVFLDGGLNQQRMGICDAVAVAKFLNATLVIPHLDVNPVWQDSSSFDEIFDVDHFIHILRDEVIIVKELPSYFSWSTREYYGTGIRATRIKTAPTEASLEWYLENVLPVLERYGIAAISPFSHRLGFENMHPNIQRLRCKTNFEALQFVRHIKDLGEIIISRLQYPPEEQITEAEYETRLSKGIPMGPKKFVALHLRFDKDMAAHSACDFGGGKAERLALAKYRKVIWKGSVFNDDFSDELLRSTGRCPLTPEETGLLLSAMGFTRSTKLYLASHKIYGGEARLSALRKLFPKMEDKKSLTTAEERARVEGKASLLAAVDFYVSIQSDIFLSASPGNMHNAVVAHRTVRNLKTIRPNMRLLGKILSNKSMEWSEFQEAVVEGHRGRLGQIRFRKATQSLYTYPAPDCMCRVPLSSANFEW